MRTLRVNYDWNPIETAPPDEDIALQVTDGRGEYILQWPCRRTPIGLDQFEEGNAAGCHAGEVEAIRRSLVRSPAPWRVRSEQRRPVSQMPAVALSDSQTASAIHRVFQAT
jgi:hypothetical protein